MSFRVLLISTSNFYSMGSKLLVNVYAALRAILFLGDISKSILFVSDGN